LISQSEFYGKFFKDGGRDNVNCSGLEVHMVRSAADPRNQILIPRGPTMSHV
jgi:hypothetical protein